MIVFEYHYLPVYRVGVVMYLDRLYTNAISQSTGKGSIDRESACREFAEPLRCIGEPDQSAFLFNSLNGISSLIRKKNDENTLLYVTKLSDIFRYILQSDKKNLVPLSEELAFIEAFQHVMVVRFANKLTFTIEVPEDKRNLRIPVLSLLPLVENVTVHNIIDSEHRMDILIRLNERMELVVSNPIYPKLTLPDTNGTGLKNLENRFLLLMNKQIRVESDEDEFQVYLPLK